MKSKILTIIIVMLSVSFSNANGSKTNFNNSKMEEMNKEDNKKIVEAYYLKVTGNEFESAIAEYLCVDYKEHQETADFSKNGLIEFYKKRQKKYPTSKSTIHRIIGQDDLVFLHVEEKISDKLTFVHGELFRIENDKIVEHWSAIQKHPKKLKSGRKMFDGQGVDYSKETGLKYAEITAQSYNDAFTLPVPEAMKVIDKTTTDRYFQHNPSVADGKEPFMNSPKLLNTLSKFGIKTTLDVQKTIAEGDYVVTLSYLRVPLIYGRNLVFDLFRVTDVGQKDEHWDIAESFKKKNYDKIFK